MSSGLGTQGGGYRKGRVGFSMKPGTPFTMYHVHFTTRAVKWDVPHERGVKSDLLFECLLLEERHRPTVDVPMVQGSTKMSRTTQK